MGSIRILDAVTVGQIAAGEIIDRPASVVKELVENAIDAAAARITVDVMQGGIARIEVSDDGVGIAAEDLRLSLRRHATSKLHAADELERISTLGFRGEGLASIAAVAHTDIYSRKPGAPIGAHVQGFAEQVGDVEPAAGPVGTSVIVSGLFENVPVRREYVRSASVEFNRISAWLASFALAYPDRTFTLRHDGKDIWIMPASGDPRERLAMVFGPQGGPRLLALDAEAARTLDGRLHGYVSAPGDDRPDRRLQLLFVNGRLVRNASLAGAWTNGYATFAMLGRHPYGVIFLEIPPANVDPNVHPTKSEVRLRYGNQVFDAVRRAIATTLTKHAKARFEVQRGGALNEVSCAPFESGLFDASHRVDIEGVAAKARILMQVDRTYIVAADDNGVLLVDQHAAHERIAYEQIATAARERSPSEPLLVPQIVELDPGRSEVLDQTIEMLREGGFDIESFGERSYRIVATPVAYGSRSFDLAGFIDDLTENPKQRGARERVWASLACHSVTVAGERLDVAEMASLVARLQSCENPMHCPHGRPTMIRLGPDEIARMFKRV